MFSDLPSPAEASIRVTRSRQGFAQAGNRTTLFGVMLSRTHRLRGAGPAATPSLHCGQERPSTGED
jgi:hypothetical protein